MQPPYRSLDERVASQPTFKGIWRGLLYVGLLILGAGLALCFAAAVMRVIHTGQGIVELAGLVAGSVAAGATAWAAYIATRAAQAWREQQRYIRQRDAIPLVVTPVLKLMGAISNVRRPELNSPIPSKVYSGAPAETILLARRGELQVFAEAFRVRMMELDGVVDAFTVSVIPRVVDLPPLMFDLAIDLRDIRRRLSMAGSRLKALLAQNNAPSEREIEGCLSILLAGDDPDPIDTLVQQIWQELQKEIQRIRGS
jgi:hypothetical protein